MEYVNNSYKNRDDNNRPQVNKVIRGDITESKKSIGRKIREAFTSEDRKSIGEYIIFDVIIPAVKNTISDLTIGAVDMWLFGDSKHSRASKNGVRTAYNTIYARDPRTVSNAQAHKDIYDYNEIILDNRGDAELVLDQMIDILEEYKSVSVAELYDLVGLPSDYTDQNYGWKSLATACVERRNNGYLIKLPKICSLK